MIYTEKENKNLTFIHLFTLSWVQNFGDEGLMLLLNLLKRLQDEKDDNS